MRHALRHRVAFVILPMIVALMALSLSAQDDPGKAVLDKMKEKRGTELEKIKEPETKILVVSGDFDEVEKVLDGLGIKYEMTDQAGLARKDLSSYTAVFINCYGETVGTGKAFAITIPPAVVSKLRSYVEGGGYLFTSDWSIVLTEKAFPEYIKKIKQTGAPNETIPVFAYKASSGHPLLKDVFTSGGDEKKTGPQKNSLKADWMIEAGSFTFDLLPGMRSKTKVLVVSEGLEKKYGSPLVAVTFTVGKGGGLPTGKKEAKKEGAVLHVIGHFFQQGLGNSNNAEVAKMYQMIVNFIVEARKAQNP